MDDAGRELMVNYYDGTSEAITMLAQRLCVPRYTIHRWASQLQLGKRHVRPWTTKEVQYLESNLHHLSYEMLAQKMNRTEAAIYLKAQDMGLNKSHEGYTLTGLASGFGVHHEKIKRWVEKGWLRGKRRQTRRTHVGDIWYFSDAAVRDFVKHHPEEVDPAKSDWLWLVDVLCDGLGELGGDKRVRGEG